MKVYLYMLMTKYKIREEDYRYLSMFDKNSKKVAFLMQFFVV